MVYSTPSGSNITMFDDSQKQVQDVQVGDVVKSYLPVGMPDEIFFDDWLVIQQQIYRSTIWFSCCENI